MTGEVSRVVPAFERMKRPRKSMGSSGLWGSVGYLILQGSSEEHDGGGIIHHALVLT